MDVIRRENVTMKDIKVKNREHVTRAYFTFLVQTLHKFISSLYSSIIMGWSVENVHANMGILFT